jgi:hypothetical protein
MTTPSPTSSPLLRLSWAFAGVAGLSLAACGGGDSDPQMPPPPPPPTATATEVPPSAYASVDAWFSYGVTQSTPANTSDTSVPLKFDQVHGEPPTSDTTEPAPLP